MRGSSPSPLCGRGRLAEGKRGGGRPARERDATDEQPHAEQFPGEGPWSSRTKIRRPRRAIAGLSCHLSPGLEPEPAFTFVVEGPLRTPRDSARSSSRCHARLLSLPTRRLIRSTDQSGNSGMFLIGGQNGHEGRCGNFHDCHALSACYPAYINGLAAQQVRTHRDPANRYSNRDAPMLPGL